MGTDRHLTYSACWFVNYWQIAVCLRIRIWNSFLKTLLDLFPVHGLLNVCMTWRCLSPEQRDITISGSRFSVGILKALFRYILQYLQPPQTVLRANMFAGIFVKSKHDRVVGESVQSLTKLIKTQQLMNSCGKCLMAFPQCLSDGCLLGKPIKLKLFCCLDSPVLQNWKMLPWLSLSSSSITLLDAGAASTFFLGCIKWTEAQKLILGEHLDVYKLFTVSDKNTPHSKAKPNTHHRHEYIYVDWSICLIDQ